MQRKWLWVVGLSVLVYVMACGANRTGAGMLTFASSWQALPTPSAVVYHSLNLPRGSMTLPAVFVGPERQPSSGCFMPSEQSAPTPVAGELATNVLREKEFEADFKAEFEAALVQAGVEASAASLLMERWSTRLKGLKVVEVDPALIRANFANEACASIALDWFEQDRTVAISAILVDSLFVELGSVADAEQRIRVAAAVQSIGTSVGLSLARSALAEEELTYASTNVFIGVMTSRLRARRCSGGVTTDLAIEERVRFIGCDGDVNVSVLRTGRASYTIQVSVPAEGLSTGAVKVQSNEVFRSPLGTIRVASGNLDADNESAGVAQVQVFVSVLEVGVSGAG